MALVVADAPEGMTLKKMAATQEKSKWVVYSLVYSLPFRVCCPHITLSDFFLWAYAMLYGKRYGTSLIENKKLMKLCYKENGK